MSSSTSANDVVMMGEPNSLTMLVMMGWSGIRIPMVFFLLWKMQRLEDDVWVDMDEKPFATMEELIAFYKKQECE